MNRLRGGMSLYLVGETRHRCHPGSMGVPMVIVLGGQHHNRTPSKRLGSLATFQENEEHHQTESTSNSPQHFFATDESIISHHSSDSITGNILGGFGARLNGSAFRGTSRNGNGDGGPATASSSAPLITPMNSFGQSATCHSSTESSSEQF